MAKGPRKNTLKQTLHTKLIEKNVKQQEKKKKSIAPKAG
jgi:hypothetical protein